MALAIDTSSSAQGNNVSSLSWSHTCTGSDLGLVVGVSIGAGTLPTISGVTYNGVSLTEVPNSPQTNGTNRCALFYLPAPASGANTVIVTLSAAASDVTAGATSFTGAHQTTLVGTSVGNTATATSISTNVSSATDEIVIDVVAHNYYTGGAISAGAGQTEQWSQVKSTRLEGAGSTKTGASTTTMSWSQDTDPDDATWAQIAVPVKPAAGGGVSGTIAATLAAFTSSIAGTTTVTGSMAVTLGSFTSAISGTKTLVGSIAQTLSDFTSSIAGTIGKVGTLGVTLSSFASAISGTAGDAVAAGRWLLRQIVNQTTAACLYLVAAVRRNRNNG